VSNCIDIVRGSVLRFSPEIIDVKAFMTRCEDIEAVVEGTDNPTKAEQALNDDQDDISWWWFLSSNSTMSDSSGWLTVRLGTGRSSHTNRDFKWAIREICKYLRKPHSVVFQITDEYDGFNQVYREKYNLKPNMQEVKAN
jgi:hypothetical protein